MNFHEYCAVVVNTGGWSCVCVCVSLVRVVYGSCVPSKIHT